MKDAYKTGAFSQAKKDETLVKVQRKRKPFFQLSLTLVVTCSVMLLLFFLVKSPQTEIASHADRAAVEQAYMERWEAFSAVVASGFEEQERIQYLATSDWSLQQALLEQKDGRVLAQLLEHMVFIIGDAHTKVVFPKVMTFEQLTAQAPALLEKLEKVYGKWDIFKLGEQRLLDMEVFYMGFWEIIGNVILYSAIIYFLYQLWRKKRNPAFAVFQVIVVLVMLYNFVRPPLMEIATSEEELLAQSLVSYKEFMGEWTDVSSAEIVEIEQFGDHLMLLIDVGDDIYVFSSFTYMKDRKGYSHARTGWGREENWVERLPAIYEGDAIGYTFALHPNHNIGRIEIEHAVTKEKASLNIPTNEASIYYLATPRFMGNENEHFVFHYYDQQGHLLE